MTGDDIQKARLIISGATEGPWEAAEFERWADNGRTPSVMAWRIFLRGHRNQATNSRDCDWTEHDARFIAAARTGWEEALDEVERVRDEVRLIRLVLHADDPERATIMIDELAHSVGIQ